MTVRTVEPFVGFDYSLGDRRGVLTFDRGRLFKRAGGTPPPEWAADFGAQRTATSEATGAGCASL